MIHVALKEGREETGLKKLELLSESILAIDILPVPPHVKRGAFVSSHVHLNVTYLCQADEAGIRCAASRMKTAVLGGLQWRKSITM